jgi:nucleotidyltransferase substrate binding protein (TIGR01987 family)
MSVSESKAKALHDAVSRLREAVEHKMPSGLASEIVRDAIIQRFEFTLEMAWKFLRFVLLDEGLSPESVASPRKTLRAAFANGLIQDEDAWLEMLRYRNTLSHTYNEDIAIELEIRIRHEYIAVFNALINQTQLC